MRGRREPAPRVFLPVNLALRRCSLPHTIGCAWGSGAVHAGGSRMPTQGRDDAIPIHGRATRARCDRLLLALAGLADGRGGRLRRSGARRRAARKVSVETSWTPHGLRDAKSTVVAAAGGRSGHGRRGQGEPASSAAARRLRCKAQLQSRKQDALKGAIEALGGTGARRLPGRLQRRQGAHRAQQGSSRSTTLPGVTGVRELRPRQRRTTSQGRPADRGAVGVGRPGRPARREHQDCRDRHGHRLHARQLRRARHGRSVQRGECGRHAASIARTRLGQCASRAASTSSATTTTPTRTTRRTSRSRTRIRTRSTATGTARMSPAPPQARA